VVPGGAGSDPGTVRYHPFSFNLLVGRCGRRPQPPAHPLAPQGDVAGKEGQGAGQQVRPRRQQDRTRVHVCRGHSRQERGGVVCFAVPLGPKVLHVVPRRRQGRGQRHVAICIRQEGRQRAGGAQGAVQGSSTPAWEWRLPPTGSLRVKAGGTQV
jgi:hypothetical protein